MKKGLPFRDAHEVVALAVRQCEDLGCDLADLDLAQLKDFDQRIEEDVFDVLTLEGSVNARSHIGGTAPARVKAEAERILSE